MEPLAYWLESMPWLVPALCDAVTLLCTAGLISLWVGRGRKVGGPSVPVGPIPEAHDQSPDLACRVRVPVRPEAETAPLSLSGAGRRKSVDDAIAAMARWEATYRPRGRGLEELERLAAERTAPEAVKIRKRS